MIICDEVHTSASGLITSPRYPLPYPTGVVCQWSIVAPPDKLIELTFVTFELTEDTGCTRDYVSVLDTGGIRHER